ncbi:Pre-mRNA-processing factor 6, partial [Coemansia sp. RSA 2703]
DPRVWLASVRLEARADPALLEPARALLARALQACPRAGCLWAEAIVLAERAQRKARAADALKHAAEDVCVLLAVARLFWVEAKVEKARAWFHRACMADPDYGDAWAWHWAFESSAQHDEGELAQQRLSDIENACASAEPRHGDVWPPVAKLPENAGLTTVDVLRLVADRLARSRNPL